MLEKLLIQETTGQRRKLRLPLLAPETTRLSPSHDSLPNQSRLGTSTTTPATTNLLSVSPRLTTLSTSHEWDQAVFVLLCPAYVTEHNVLEVHPCCSRCQHGLPFLRLNHSPLYGGTTLCLSFIHQWTVGSF